MYVSEGSPMGGEAKTKGFLESRIRPPGAGDGVFVRLAIRIKIVIQTI